MTKLSIIDIGHILIDNVINIKKEYSINGVSKKGVWKNVGIDECSIGQTRKDAETKEKR